MPETELKNEPDNVKKESRTRKILYNIFVKDWKLKLLALGLGIFTWVIVALL